jgi:hypothetical protein
LEEYEEMTPRELMIRLKAEDIKRQNQWTLMVEQALLMSRWVWKQTITQQEIDKIVNRDNKEYQRKEKMTDDEMLAQVKTLNALFGGEVRIIKE